MDLRQHALAGHAEGLRQRKTGTEGFPPGTRRLPPDGQARQDGRRMGSRHQRSDAAQDGGEGTCRMQYHHCRHGSLTRGGDDLPLPLRAPGMQTAGTPPLDFVPHGRGDTQGNGEPAARRDVRPYVPGFRQPQQGGLASGNERKLCALQGNRAGQPLAGQGADPRAGCRQQPLP